MRTLRARRSHRLRLVGATSTCCVMSFDGPCWLAPVGPTLPSQHPVTGLIMRLHRFAATPGATHGVPRGVHVTAYASGCRFARHLYPLRSLFGR